MRKLETNESIYRTYNQVMVYMIKVVNKDKYKIGVTARESVQKRFASIQFSCLYILSIYSTCYGHASEESQIHEVPF